MELVRQAQHVSLVEDEVVIRPARGKQSECSERVGLQVDPRARALVRVLGGCIEEQIRSVGFDGLIYAQLPVMLIESCMYVPEWTPG